MLVQDLGYQMWKNEQKINDFFGRNFKFRYLKNGWSIWLDIWYCNKLVYGKFKNRILFVTTLPEHAQTCPNMPKKSVFRIFSHDDVITRTRNGNLLKDNVCLRPFAKTASKIINSFSFYNEKGSQPIRLQHFLKLKYLKNGLFIWIDILHDNKVR